MSFYTIRKIYLVFTCLPTFVHKSPLFSITSDVVKVTKGIWAGKIKGQCKLLSLQNFILLQLLHLSYTLTSLTIVLCPGFSFQQFFRDSRPVHTAADTFAWSLPSLFYPLWYLSHSNEGSFLSMLILVVCSSMTTVITLVNR